MDTIATVKKLLNEGFDRLSKQYSIPKEKVIINISKNSSNELDYNVFNDYNYLETLPFDKIIHLGILVVFKDKIIGYLKKAVERYSEKTGNLATNLVLRYENNEIKINVVADSKVFYMIGIKDIIYGEHTEKYIKIILCSLKRLASQYNISESSLRIMIDYTNGQEKYFLYNKTNFIKEASADEIFKDEMNFMDRSVFKKKISDYMKDAYRENKKNIDLRIFTPAKDNISTYLFSERQPLKQVEISEFF